MEGLGRCLWRVAVLGVGWGCCYVGVWDVVAGRGTVSCWFVCDGGPLRGGVCFVCAARVYLLAGLMVIKTLL